MDSLPRTPEEYRTWWKQNTDVPFGHCWCGCGETTKTPSSTNRRRLRFMDAPVRFRLGHTQRKTPFAYHCEDRGYASECWIWDRSAGTTGRAQVWDGTKMRSAHRVLYEKEFDVSLDGKDLHHQCKQPLCVRPTHMSPLSPKRHRAMHREEKSKSGYARAEQIRELYATGKYRQSDLALIFGLSQYGVSLIVRRKVWDRP